MTEPIQPVALRVSVSPALSRLRSRTDSDTAKQEMSRWRTRIKLRALVPRRRS